MSGFIVFEGADGVGTTTQASKLAEYFYWLFGEDNVKYTSEPTDLCTGKLIKNILLGREVLPSNNVMELLFRADRINHVEKIIIPWLNDKKWVICDRYFPSTLVYQGMRDTVVNSLDAMENMFDRFMEEDNIILPDLTIVLDVDVEICQDRIKKRNCNKEIYEEIDFQHKVRHLYLEWVNAKWDNVYSGNKNKKIVVDANGTEKDVYLRCLKALEKSFSESLGIKYKLTVGILNEIK